MIPNTIQLLPAGSLSGFPFHLYLADVLIALPLQEVDLLQQLLLMEFQLPHRVPWFVALPVLLPVCVGRRGGLVPRTAPGYQITAKRDSRRDFFEKL